MRSQLIQHGHEYPVFVLLHSNTDSLYPLADRICSAAGHLEAHAGKFLSAGSSGFGGRSGLDGSSEQRLGRVPVGLRHHLWFAVCPYI